MQGHGRTADSERPFSYASLADDVAGVLKHLGIGKADVLGYCRAVPTDILHSLARVVVTPTGRRDRLGGVERREGTVDDHPMPTMARPQQRYDYRLRNLVQRTGDVTVATNLGVPRSTARGWLGAAPTVVVCLDVADLTEPQLRQEVLKLGRRVQKLAALLRLAVSLLRTSGFSLNGARLPDGRAKMRILRAVDRTHEYLPLRTVLRYLRMSPSRFHAWRRRQRACALDDQSSCPRTSPYRLTPPEVRAIKDMVTSPEYRHVPTGTLAVLAQGSARSGPRPRPGTASSGRPAGGGPASACIRRSQRWGCARPALMKCGTSTPPSSAC
jgi:hypothetical protein